MIAGISLIRFGVDDILNTTELIDSQGTLTNGISLFFRPLITDLLFLCAEITGSWIPQPYGVNAKIIRRIIGKFFC
jgi:hypothetical protein